MVTIMGEAKTTRVNAPLARTECSTREAARLLGVSVSTVQLWVDGGELEAWKTVGGHRRVSVASVERLLQRQHGTANAAAPGTAPGVVTVVLVEDDADLVSLYDAVISGWELPVKLVTATNGFEGLIEVGRVQPDLLITDLFMPGMDGFQMLASLRAGGRFEHMEVVVVTGLNEADIQAKGGLPEGVRLFGKPVPFERLKALVQDLQARHAHGR